MRSIAIGNHSRHGKAYPTRLAAHVAVRTLRRFMERGRGAPFESVVVCTASHEEYLAFGDVMRCYFPRDAEEAAVGAGLLSRADVGDEIGEAWLPERDIQIGGHPDASAASTPGGPGTPDARDSMFSSFRRSASPLTPLSQNVREEDLASAFMSPSPDPDAERSRALGERRGEGPE